MKNGCESGHCGACTVIVNGRAQRACLLRLGKLDGAQVETIESLSHNGDLHPLQQAFVALGAIQCGFCTPGMIMTAKALLDKNPHPSRADIIKALDLNRNTCRCTGYVNIIEAIEKAADLMFNGKPLPAVKAESGFTMLPDEAIARATGRTPYADDIRLEGMLYGKVLWSEHPHAKILDIDTARASSMPGVQAIITAADLPGRNIRGVVIKDEPAIAQDKVRYIGDSLAAVFADTPEQAAAAVEAIGVRYQPLPGVFSAQEAAAEGAPKVHEGGNLMHHARIQRGEVEAAFASCAVVVEGTFKTPHVEHGFLEPESGIGLPQTDGGVTVQYPTQTAFDDQKQLAAMLDLPLDKVRVVQTPTGGAFGGKEDMLVHQFLALGALKTGRPVKITLSREESLRVHVKRHPAEMHYKTGADAEGRILAIQSKVVLDTGAYTSLGLDVLENTLVFGAGPYYVPNLDLQGWAWYTNNVPSGAMRGFGVNQVAIALEQQLDEIARQLEMDPLDLRLLNALDVGLPTAGDHVLEPGVPGIKETLQATKEALAALALPASDGRKLGVGVASAVKNIGYGHGLPESAGAILELESDGHITLKASQHEYGQGANAALAMMISEELGTPLDWIDIIGPDTAQTPETGPTTASRQTFMTGNATLMACSALKQELFGHAAEILDCSPEELSLQRDKVVNQASGQGVKLSELGERFVVEKRYTPPESAPLLEDEASLFGQPDFESRPTHWCYAYNTQAAIVAVDEKRGSVEVLHILSANDVGHALNHRAIEGQIHGGVMMGLGYALSERYLVDQGIPVTETLHDIRLPLAGDTPKITPILVEVPHPEGPHGLKGFAEAPSLATAPAILNAIYDAVGVRLYEIPADRLKLKAALDAKRESV
jgi:CO/xanthine dehydrogenase Mo-binding subunit/aerobic-type carbon monoxide dehydrogenase small subunit (CoxS/CutS family)